MKAIVVGAGLGGLLSAAELTRRGGEVVVFESGERPGGIARTITSDGYLFEPAAGAFLLPHPMLSPLLSLAGVAVDPVPGSRERLYWTGERLVEIPTNPRAAFASSIVGPSAKARAVAEIAVRSHSGPGESLVTFMRRRFGPSVGLLLADLMATGVFAGDPAVIAAAAFPRLVELEARYGSLLRAAAAGRKAPQDTRPVLHAPSGGMTALAEALAALPVDVRYGHRVTSVARKGERWLVDGSEADAVVLAVDPGTAATILEEPPAELGMGAPLAHVAVVGLGYPTAAGLPGAFGVLTSREAGLATLGVLFENATGRAQAGHRLARVILGGARRPDVAAWSDDRLVEVAAREIATVLGARLDPTWTMVARGVIPQHSARHLARVARIESDLGDALALGGWWYRAIGVTALALDAGRIAERLAGGRG